MMYLQEAGGATFGAKAAIAGMICSFGFFTTGERNPQLIQTYFAWVSAAGRDMPTSSLFDQFELLLAKVIPNTWILLSLGLLHWFTVPYVHRLRYDRATRMVEVDTLNLFAQHKSTTFHVSEAKPPNSVRPLSTFQVPIAGYMASLLSLIELCVHIHAMLLELFIKSLLMHCILYFLS